MKKSFAVLGLGKFGESIAIELANAGADVLAVDLDKERVHEISDIVTCAVKADVRETETMKSLGISNMDAVIVAITGNLDASILATIFAKDVGVPYVFAKSKDPIHTKILEKVGADKVIIPEHESGIRVARQMLTDNVLDFVELSENFRMVEIKIKPEWVGKSLRSLDLRRNHHINVIALRQNGEVNVSPDPDELLSDNITMLITVSKKDLSKLTKD